MNPEFKKLAELILEDWVRGGNSSGTLNDPGDESGAPNNK